MSLDNTSFDEIFNQYSKNGSAIVTRKRTLPLKFLGGDQ